MIEKLETSDFRPVTFIAKVNEIIDKLNEWQEREDAAISGVVEDTESSDVNRTTD